MILLLFSCLFTCLHNRLLGVFVDVDVYVVIVVVFVYLFIPVPGNLMMYNFHAINHTKFFQSISECSPIKVFIYIFLSKVLLLKLILDSRTCNQGSAQEICRFAATFCVGLRVLG